MTDAKTQLVQEALMIGSDFYRSKQESEKKQARLTSELQHEKAMSDAAGLALERSRNFRATLGTDFACPNCWVRQGVESPLIAQSSPNDDDWFKCRVCDHEFSFPA